MPARQSSQWSGLDAAWKRASNPSTSAALLLATAVVFWLALGAGFATLLGLARLLAVLSAGAVLALVASLWDGPSSWHRGLEEWLRAREVVNVLPFPFFAVELDETAISRLEARRGRPTALMAARVAAVALPPLLFAVWMTMPDTSGYVALLTGEEVEAYRRDGVDEGVRYALGFRLELESVAGSEESRWTIDLRATDVRRDVSADVSLAPGDRRLVGGRYLAIRELRPYPGIGAVTVSATPRGGGESSEVTLRRGAPVELTDGTTLELVDSSLSFLTQLGPAVQIREVRDGTIVRTDWIHIDVPAADAAHGRGNYAVQVVEYEPPLAVVLSVGANRAPVTVGFALGWLSLLLGVFAWRSDAAHVRGRDGDFELVVRGGRADAIAFGNSLLPESLRDEWLGIIGEDSA